jgi:hypothetical protein
MTNLKLNNIEIAKLTGWYHYKDIRKLLIFGQKTPAFKNSNYKSDLTVFPDFFKYHKNWDQLMAVLEFVCLNRSCLVTLSLGVNTHIKINNVKTGISYELKGKLHNKKEIVFNCIVKFAKDYNKKNSKRI